MNLCLDDRKKSFFLENIEHRYLFFFFIICGLKWDISDIESFSYWAFWYLFLERNEQSTNQFVMISGIFCEQH